MDAFKNFAKSTLASGITSGATSLSVASGQGARFPTVPFNAVIWEKTTYADPADDPNVEIVRVTAVATDALTVTRAQEGTSAVAHNTGGKTYGIIAPVTAKTLNTDVPLLGIARLGTAIVDLFVTFHGAVVIYTPPAGTKALPLFLMVRNFSQNLEPGGFVSTFDVQNAAEQSILPPDGATPFSIADTADGMFFFIPLTSPPAMISLAQDTAISVVPLTKGSGLTGTMLCNVELLGYLVNSSTGLPI